MPALPATLAPPAPFPLVVGQSFTSEFVAPGVRRGTYRLQTSDGPLVVSIVAVDTHEPTVRFGAVVANDRLLSSGETVSSMARRTGAVAGVNADYFDIGNTNQPLNLVVNHGRLVRTPSKRVVLDVRVDRSVHYENVTFSGALHYGSTSLALTAVNEFPPQGGVAFLNAGYGTVKAAPGVLLAEIVPIDVAHVASQIAGAYRVATIGPSQMHVVHGSELGFGPAALALAPPPAVGDAVTIEAETTPPLADIVCAVGGGPLLIANGMVVDDPNAPAPEERSRRFPVSGAASLPGGEVLLASVDGHAPALSIGLTRPQFAALFLGFGASDAMAFDSGGSAELVARVLGDAEASVAGSPSDGEERAVADALFVYSDAPLGPPAQLVVRPSAIVALPHAVVAVRAAIVDAAGHALGITHLDGGDAVRAGDAFSVTTVRSRSLHADLPIDVVNVLSRLDLALDVRHPEPAATIRLLATGFDVRGRVVALGDAVKFRADRGTIVPPDRYRASDRDARVTATAGGASATLTVRVGRHVESLPFFDAAHAVAWQFASAPGGARRALALINEPPELRLGYDFTGDERAAYARATGLVLPGEPLFFGVEIAGDASGVAVRASFVNRLGETRVLTLAKSVDWRGWQERTIPLPDDLNPPVRLGSLYIVNSLGTQPARSSGTLAFRKPSVVVAGRP